MRQSYTPEKGILSLENKSPLQQSNIQLSDSLILQFMMQTPNLALIIDDQARLITASKSFFKFFNIDEKNAINKDFLTLIPARRFG